MTSKLSPTDALRAIRRVLADKSLTPGERRAVAAVILRADCETALAWAGYRSLHDETGLTPKVISTGLRAGEAQGYLERAGTGFRGRFSIGFERCPQGSAHRYPQGSAQRRERFPHDL